jgi:hypothetical protein
MIVGVGTGIRRLIGMLPKKLKRILGVTAIARKGKIEAETLTTRNQEAGTVISPNVKTNEKTNQTTNPHSAKSRKTNPYSAKSQKTNPYSAKSQKTNPYSAKSRKTNPHSAKSRKTNPHSAKSRRTNLHSAKSRRTNRKSNLPLPVAETRDPSRQSVNRDARHQGPDRVPYAGPKPKNEAHRKQRTGRNLHAGGLRVLALVQTRQMKLLATPTALGPDPNHPLKPTLKTHPEIFFISNPKSMPTPTNSNYLH